MHFLESGARVCLDVIKVKSSQNSGATVHTEVLSESHETLPLLMFQNVVVA